MSKTFQLDIFSAEKTIYHGPAVSLTAPGEAGYLGVLPNHAPLLTTLIPGKIVWKDAEGKSAVLESKTRGFLEIFKNEVNVILSLG